MVTVWAKCIQLWPLKFFFLKIIICACPVSMSIYHWKHSLEYDALLYVARRLTGKRLIDWTAEFIQQYCKEKYESQEMGCFGPTRGVPEKQRNAWKSRKTLFQSKAGSHTVAVGDKGEMVLLKNGLQVLCTKDYERVLQRFHDHNIHEGAKIKCSEILEKRWSKHWWDTCPGHA